jgi:hypothetical protein
MTCQTYLIVLGFELVVGFELGVDLDLDQGLKVRVDTT